MQQELDLEELWCSIWDLPKKSFFVIHSVCRHIHRNKKVWMGIKMNKGDVTARKMLWTNGTIDERQHLKQHKQKHFNYNQWAEKCDSFDSKNTSPTLISLEFGLEGGRDRRQYKGETIPAARQLMNCNH